MLHTCKATLNGLEAMLARGRDQTTALDEMRQMEEKPRQNLIFNLAAGHGKGRMRKDLTMQNTIEWDSQIITLSGEQSVTELLGGWPAAFLAQRRLRHKCSKSSYQFVFWLIVFAWQFAAFDSLQNWKFSKAALNRVESMSDHRR